MPFQPLNTGNSLESNFSQVNGLMTDFRNDKSVRVIKDDTGTPVVILSKNGLQTTSPGGGIDVTSATNSQFTFNSSQDTFKIVKTINFSITQPATSQNTYSKPHGLSITPVILPILAAGLGQYWTMPTYTNLTRDDVNGVIKFGSWVNAYADATNVSIQFFNATATPQGNYNFKIFVLQETAI